MEYLNQLFIERGINQGFAGAMTEGVGLGLLFLLTLLAYQVTKRWLMKKLTIFIESNKVTFDNQMMEAGVFARASLFVPAIVVDLASPYLTESSALLQELAQLVMIALTVYVADALLNAAEAIYKTKKIAKARPIKGYLQVIKILVFLFAAIAFFSELMGRSPLYLISGLGAMTAVLMLVFKDSILGLVAGVQLAVNDMVRIGDWIEMPGHDANGDVIDISLHTVKVSNFDRTITTIPTYSLISHSFKNWRGMSQSGGRRIKRSLLIDMNSIRFLSPEEIYALQSIHCLQSYLKKKGDEINAYNQALDQSAMQEVNGRHQTNVGVFRAYMENYLKNHPRILKEAIIMARQLPPGDKGLPLEIYCFADTTVWAEYEGIQADLFDHFLAVLPHFGLRIFQEPTGSDLRRHLVR